MLQYHGDTERICYVNALRHGFDTRMTVHSSSQVARSKVHKRLSFKSRLPVRTCLVEDQQWNRDNIAHGQKKHSLKV